MLIKVRVLPKSSQNSIIEEIGKDFDLKVKITVAPENGKANKEVVRLLAKHFHKKQAEIKIIKGLTVKNKIIQIC
jgi:hypothetical protein